VPASPDELDEYRLLCRARLERLVQVREPLVLISQVQRSGGTLLSQLFDGHPACHAHPHEICIGKPMKWDWPPLDLSRPNAWLPTLHEPLVLDWLRSGYVKDQTARTRPELQPDVFPFLFSPHLQRRIFAECVEARAPARERDVLDCYFTSYFNAWLDNQNLYAAPKRVVTGFTPRLAMELERVERFFAAYPDGFLVSLVRDPRAWFASAAAHRRYYRDVEQALGLWRRSTEATLEAAERFGARVFLLTYEELVGDLHGTVAALAAWIGIDFRDELLTPTFNGLPIRANSSRPVDAPGVLLDRKDAYREVLDAETIARIDRLAGDLYDRAAEAARRQRAGPSGAGRLR
jgi:NAD(P)-dependent dehydrogenase (short-subunit alcohol dehydrogenase family)